MEFPWNFTFVLLGIKILNLSKIKTGKNMKHKYSDPIIQTFLVQLGRIIGM